MKTLKEKIEVMQRCNDGGQVEFDSQSTGSWRPWRPEDKPDFDWARNDYRIKKEPEYFWINEYDCGDGVLARVCLNEKDNDEPEGTGNLIRTIKVQVIE